GDGVLVRSTRVAPTQDNLIEGNFIGIDVSGTRAIANGDHGVQIVDAASNTVGGTTAAARNIIAGNTRNGVLISSTGAAAATGNLVEGNFIGTDVTGTLAVANGDHGVQVADAASNTIGGTTAAARNIIAGNSRDGVLISGYGVAVTTGNLV